VCPVIPVDGIESDTEKTSNFSPEKFILWKITLQLRDNNYITQLNTSVMKYNNNYLKL